MKKFILSFICITYLILGFNVSASNKSILDGDFKPDYVNDFANVINQDTEDYITSKNKELEALSGAQIVFMTVDSLEGRDIETVSIDLARKMQIGDKEKNNGILILISIEDREFRMEVGYGLEGYIPDTIARHLLDDNLVDSFKAEKYDEGIKNLADSLFEKVYNFEGMTEEEKQQAIDEQNNNIEIYITIIVLLAIVFFIIFVLAVMASSGSGGGGGTYYGGYSSSSSGSSSSGFGSGGFSGGGGGFGGGGASGGW